MRLIKRINRCLSNNVQQIDLENDFKKRKNQIEQNKIVNNNNRNKIDRVINSDNNNKYSDNNNKYMDYI